MSLHKIENTVYTGTSRAAAQRVMILLHGRGASAQSILPLADALDLKDFAVIAPNATNGTWYPNSFMAPVAQNEPYLSSALDLVKAICDQLLAEGWSTRQLYFAGFSQGACLTAEFIGRHAAAYGGAFIFTGGLIGEHLEPTRYRGNFEGTPVFLGSADPDFHVPVERVYATGNIFRDLGATVTEKIYPGIGHTIIDDEIEIAQRILAGE